VLYILLVNCCLHFNFMFAYSAGINSLCNHGGGIHTEFHSAYDAYVTCIDYVFVCPRIINNLCVVEMTNNMH
jgi:hypothetical protein